MVTWKIVELKRDVSTDLVNTVRWSAGITETVGSSETEKIYSAQVSGLFDLQPSENTVPFQDLTNDIVIGWVKDKLGAETVASIEENLPAQIAEQKLPPRIIAGFPETWSTTT